MHRLQLLVVSAVLGSACAAFATGSVVVRTQVEFTGDSTLHGFTGTAEVADFPLRPAGTATASSPSWGAAAEAPVATLATGSAARDARMRELLEGDRHPRIRAHFPRVEPAQMAPAESRAARITLQEAAGDPAAARTVRSAAAAPPARCPGGRWAAHRAALPMQLEVRGLVKPVTAEVRGWTEHLDCADRTLRAIDFDVAFSFLLSDFGIDPPSVLGLVRVDDRITALARVTVERER